MINDPQEADMKIKRMASSFQEVAKSNDAEFLASTEPSLQSGLASAEDNFQAGIISKQSKLFMDNEIDSPHDSRDMFQIIDQVATHELGQEKHQKKFRHKRLSSTIKIDGFD
jgi:hypothetical protein